MGVYVYTPCTNDENTTPHTMIQPALLSLHTPHRTTSFSLPLLSWQEYRELAPALAAVRLHRAVADNDAEVAPLQHTYM